MKNTRKWTNAEENELIALISENKGNFQEAFRLFHNKHRKRSIKAIKQRWYGTLRLRNDVNVCLVTSNKKSKMLATPKKSTISFWKRVIKMFKW